MRDTLLLSGILCQVSNTSTVGETSVGRHYGQQRIGDVPGQSDVALHLVEPLTLNCRQRFFLRVDYALLQAKIDFAEGHG